MINSGLGVIGAGNMATSIVKGVLEKGIFEAGQIHIYDVISRKLLDLQKDISIVAEESNMELVRNCPIFIVAVKPDAIGSVLDEIKGAITPNHVLVSIVAGVSTDYIKERIDYRCEVVRVMPNTPALVGEGMSAICSNHGLDESKSHIVESIFSALGRVELVDESLINAVTAISGSSPAYAFMFIEAMADGGVKMGLPRDIAYKLAAQAVLGSAKMVLESGEHPGYLKDMVCSPGGTTIDAVFSLEKNGFRGIIMEAVEACALKSSQMENAREDHGK